MKAKLYFLILGLAFASVASAHTKDFYAGAFASPHSETKLTAATAQTGSGGHSVTLTFTASSSAASCTTPCTFGYNVFRGTATGGESTTPLNASPITTTSYVDSTITLGSSPITYFYTVEAVETLSGVTVASGPSNEATASFPGIPSQPATLVATPK